MTSEPATYPSHRFPAEVIRYAVWLYHLFGLSLRDVELTLAERGGTVTHASARQRFGAAILRAEPRWARLGAELAGLSG